MGLKIASLSDSAARPQRLSLCMIVKDEEEALPRCLESVRGVVDEIVVVDTGSTDRTVAIAESFGARVVHEPWTGDFAHHRNTSLDAATGDWILVLDADEELVGGEALRPLLNDPDMEGYSLREVNFIGDEAGLDAVVNAAFRVFRNRERYRYDGALHEQIQAKVDPDGGVCTRFVSVEINHYGYLDPTTEARDKKDRNMRIVMGEVRRKPTDAFTLFNAGVEFQRIGDFRTALDYFTRAFSHLQNMRQYFASLLVRNIVASLKQLERYDEALEVVADALDAYPDFTDLHYLEGQLHFARREYREAIGCFRRAIELGDHAGDRYMSQAGMGSWNSWFALGTLHEGVGDLAEAVRCYKNAVTSARGYNPAPLVRLTQLLVREDDPDRVEAFMLGILPVRRRGDAVATVGEVFLNEGHPDRARRLLEQALAENPGAHGTRVTLAHCRLAAGDPDAALAILDEVPPTSEAAPHAHAKRLLVGVACDRPDVADAAVAAVGDLEGGLYAAAWRLAADAVRGAGVPGPAVAGHDPAQVQGVVFDLASALLDLGRLEAFNALVPVLYAVAPDRPLLDESLGHLLLRHSFPDPAADRLLAAVRAGRDDPATLAALGHLCAHKGLDEDAEVFLTAALRADRQSMSRYLDLASQYAGTGKHAEAGEVVRAGLALWPHSTVLRELSGSLEMIAGALAAG
jgi:tetratricopeptide (TPR) repeat protein